MSDTKEKKIPRHERLFPKLIHLPKKRKAEFEAMAKKEDLKLATWIQNHVGDLQELETYVKDFKLQVTHKKDYWDANANPLDNRYALGEIDALKKVLEFIEALKTKA